MKKTIIFTLFLFLIFTASCGIGDNIGVKTQDPVIETPTPTESKVTEVPLTETPEETPPPPPSQQRHHKKQPQSLPQHHLQLHILIIPWQWILVYSHSTTNLV